MSKLDDAVGEAIACLSKCGINEVNVTLLRAVTKGLGPSAYGGDGENVACSDSAELARIRTNFLVKKLGMSDGEATLDSVESVCAAMKPAGSHKRRSAFYYLLTIHHGKEAVYGV